MTHPLACACVLEATEARESRIDYEKGFVKTSWPYDDEAAKTIECYARRMKVSADVPSGKAWRMVYVWRDTRDADQNYSYTVQGEFTGATETANLSDAIDAATAGATR